MTIKLIKVPNDDEYTYMPDYSNDARYETVYMDDTGESVPPEQATHGITRVYDSKGELIREEFLFCDPTAEPFDPTNPNWDIEW